MEFIATQKYMLLSPRKLRPIASQVKRMSIPKARELLPFLTKKGAVVILKVINQAVANAKNKNVEVEKLTIKEIQIGEGPRLKRGNPVSRGMWHPIKKRMSHIRVVLESKEETKNGTKS